MKTLGLTGGIGSGKSAAARIFEDLGAATISADDEARRLMQEDPEVVRRLSEAFGGDVFREDGSLDRKRLASKVFGRPDEVARLNAIVHPRVKAEFPSMVRRAAESGAPLLVYEAALLVEAGVDDRFDAIAVVDAPSELRIRRVMQRDDASRQDVEDRMRHQLPAKTLLAHADFVIDNSGDEAHLRKQVEAIFRNLVSRN